MTVDLGQGLELASDSRTRAGRRRRPRARHRRARRVRARVHPAGAAGRARSTRIAIRWRRRWPSAHREAPGRDRADGGRDRDRARLHRHAQRSGAPRERRSARSIHRFGDRAAQVWTATSRRRSSSRGARLRVPVPPRPSHSIDTNLWGRAIASGGLEDAWVEPPGGHLHADALAAGESRIRRPTSSSTSKRACRSAPTASTCRCSS